jgi:hypothetical protein
MKIVLGCLIALFLLFFVHNSDSSELMVMQYNENVRIVLSKDKCDKGEGFKAVAQRIDKEVMQACWIPKGKMIHIQWEGGDFSDFDVTRFYEVNP